jgi:hypothetical protein
VGAPFVLEGASPLTNFVAVFEDDGDTGYLYGLDRSGADQPILDALHIYNVSAISDRSLPSKFQIVWSADGLKAALYINDYPHAAFDFAARRGYCRSNFPPPSPAFAAYSHEWSDSVLTFFH